MDSLLDITAEQRKVMEELKKRTIQDVTPKMLEDEFLFYRFCKACDFNLSDSETMLRKHITFRKQMNMDDRNYKPPEVLEKYVPTSYVCFDKDGSVVRYSDIGQADIKAFWKCVTKMEMLKFLMMQIEYDTDLLNLQSKKLGKPLMNIVYIFDYNHFSLAVATHLQTLQNLLFFLKNYVDNYPERLKCGMIINGSIYYNLVFNVAKSILPATIIKKLPCYGTEGWKEALLEMVDTDQLPAFLGGNRTDPDGNPLCETFLKHGKKVPEMYYRSISNKQLPLASDIEKLTLRPFSKEGILFKVNEDDLLLEWEFETKNKDVGFALYFQEDSRQEGKPAQLIPMQRVDTCYEPEKGMIRCNGRGTYIVVFDNSYSWIHTKEIYYRIRLVNPDEVEN
ncbi:SEC14-like protein 2 [Caerostris darwini]|uniref:SEC14-like protein 2 n=1 Tax=Caerostris darwini TaxID=1538125 RepID=A0AAV4X2Z8_9ARAC|nr:SEC14-like protein 2 [Caerostris darwini]